MSEDGLNAFLGLLRRYQVAMNPIVVFQPQRFGSIGIIDTTLSYSVGELEKGEIGHCDTPLFRVHGRDVGHRGGLFDFERGLLARCLIFDIYGNGVAVGLGFLRSVFPLPPPDPAGSSGSAWSDIVGRWVLKSESGGLRQ